MAVTQLFQVTVDNNERNRVAAGQFRSRSLVEICSKTILKTGRKVDNGISLNSMFSIAMYFFGLVWTETCNFGSAILVGSALIVLGYLA